MKRRGVLREGLDVERELERLEPRTRRRFRRGRRLGRLVRMRMRTTMRIKLRKGNPSFCPLGCQSIMKKGNSSTSDHHRLLPYNPVGPTDPSAGSFIW